MGFEKHVFFREVFEGVVRNCQSVKNSCMSGDTYLFRRSLSIDRLGHDLSKMTLAATFDMWSEAVDKGKVLYLSTLRVFWMIWFGCI